MKKIILFLTLSLAWLLFADSSKDKIEDFLFTVESADGARGSAFLMNDADGVWMVSNYHVVSGSNHVEFISMNNKDRKLELPEEVEIASDRDAFRFRVKEENGFSVASSCEFDDAVYAFGNSGGLGIITKSKGAVVGKGLKDVEVSCEIIPGNSGGPVINDKNQVVGIASYIVKPAVVELSKEMLETLTSFERTRLENKLKEIKGTRYEDTRRFSISLKEVAWQKVPLEIFCQESTEFLEQKHISEKIEKLIVMAMNPTVTVPETAGEPFLEKRWVRQYNYDIPSSFDSFLGKVFIKGNRDSFYKRYGRCLLSMQNHLCKTVDDQKGLADTQFSINYFSQQLRAQTEQSSKLLGVVKTMAEEYKNGI